MKGISSYRKVVWTTIAVCAVLAVIGVIYASVDAYHDIRRLKTGSIWHIPSRVYSRPLLLSPGMDIEKAGLVERLRRLRYRKVTKVKTPGEFSRDKTGITLYTRTFPYVGRQYGAELLRIRVEGRRITLVSRPGKKDTAAWALLEPECIAEIYDDKKEDRTIVRLEECPEHLIDAVLATEDRRFYRHLGIDLRALARAAVSNLRHGAVQQGGSTITQQLVKNLFLTRTRTVSRKLKDMWMAVIMEVVYSKEEILNMYINEIYLGSYNHTGVCGLGRASRVLFDKGISDVSLSEAALMAGMIKAPNAYSPYDEPEKALARRNTVLSLMLRQGKISEKEYRKAKGARLRVAPIVPGRRQAPYFVDHVISLIRDQFPGAVLEKGGYQIYTTLDLQMQKTAEAMLSRGLSDKDRRVDGATVIMDPKTGEVLALVGGKGYAGSQFNRAVSIRRQIGSLIKPVVYYTALRRGFTLTTWLDDSPLSLRLGDGTVWTPSNYDLTVHGSVMLKDALSNSYNLATVKLGLQFGVANMLLELGKALPRKVSNTNPSVLLGAISFSPLDMAVLYSSFANGGSRVEPVAVRAVCDEKGAVIQSYPAPAPVPALDSSTVYLLNTALREVIISGTASDARIYGMPPGVCGKTGTTDDHRDSWFVGFTPRMVVTVWLGADEYRSIGHSGASGAMPIASMILARLSPPVTWTVPQNIVFCTIDPANGKLATLWTTGGLDVPYIRDTQPTEVSDTGPGLPSLEDIPRALDYLKSWIWKPEK